jgi:hypothetical protein
MAPCGSCSTRVCRNRTALLHGKRWALRYSYSVVLYLSRVETMS